MPIYFVFHNLANHYQRHRRRQTHQLIYTLLDTIQECIPVVGHVYRQGSVDNFAGDVVREISVSILIITAREVAAVHQRAPENLQLMFPSVPGSAYERASAS